MKSGIYFDTIVLVLYNLPPWRLVVVACCIKHDGKVKKYRCTYLFFTIRIDFIHIATRPRYKNGGQ